MIAWKEWSTVKKSLVILLSFFILSEIFLRLTGRLGVLSIGALNSLSANLSSAQLIDNILLFLIVFFYQ